MSTPSSEFVVDSSEITIKQVVVNGTESTMLIAERICLDQVCSFLSRNQYFLEFPGAVCCGICSNVFSLCTTRSCSAKDYAQIRHDKK